MTQGKYRAQVNECEKFLTRLDLFERRILYPRYDRCCAGDFRGKPYFAVWKKCLDEELYDIRLVDASLIQLRASFKPLDANYTYLQAPFSPIPDEDTFLESEMFARGEDADEYEILRDYELLTAERRDCVTPIRYDYQPHQYNQGLHPASHMHFGHGNEIRIGTHRVLQPLSFVLFVVRQFYPLSWRIVLKMSDAGILCRNVSQNLDPVNNDFLGKCDGWEMYLT